VAPLHQLLLCKLRLGLRLQSPAGNPPPPSLLLQPRSVVGVPTIYTDFGAVFRIDKGSPNFGRSITLDLGGKAHQIIFW
jgi:hypothetical protein